jgi:hypothetical protein
MTTLSDSGDVIPATPRTVKRPAFQFYPSDWLASMAIMLMTPAEEGAYVRLLCHC